jgi:hypothetical protein
MSVKICFVALVVFLLGSVFSRAQDIEINGGSSGGAPSDGIRGGPNAGQIASEDGEGAGGMSLLTKLPVHLTLFTEGGYDDNSDTSSNGGGSWFTKNGLRIFYNLPSERTHLDIHAGADLTYYPERTSGKSNDINSYLDGLLTHPFSTRLKLTLSVSIAYRTEPDFSSNVGNESQRADYFFTSDRANLSYDWTPRISTVTSDTIRIIEYTGSSSNSQLNRFENTAQEQFRFHLVPNDLTLIGEYRFQIIDYESLPRDSTTHYTLAGFDKTFTPQLSTTFRGGATFRSYTNGGDRTDPHFDSSLHYHGAHGFELTWTTSYGVEEPGQADITSRTTFRTGLLAKYRLSSRIDATVTGYYHHDWNDVSQTTGPSSSSTEDGLDVTAKLRYAIRGFLTADISYQHTEVSGSVNQDYARNRYAAGLTFTY